jgi:hypothetical protein
LEFVTPKRSKGERCLEIFCIFLFLSSHINLDGLNKIGGSKELRHPFQEGTRTERVNIIKSNTEDYEREEPDQKINLNSFNMDFCVGKGGFGKVWKVYEKTTNRVYAMK